MSVSPASEETIRKRYPYPIAAAWNRVKLATAIADRIRHLLTCNEVVLRTLVAFLLPDYLRGAPVAAVERLLEDFGRRAATDGKWLELVRELVRCLGERSERAAFVPEALTWFAAAGDSDLSMVIQVRNDIVHGVDQRRTKTREQMTRLQEAMRSTLSGMGWIASYRALRVVSSEASRRRLSGGGWGPYFAGKVQFFTGVEEQCEPLTAGWDAVLVTDRVYLLNADSSAVLELSPFLEWLPDQEHLYLCRGWVGFKKLTRAHDDSATVVEKGVTTDDDGGGEVSFKNWLAAREDLDLVQRVVTATGGLRPRPVTEGPDPNDLGSRFRKIGELGQGGMATVFRVHDVELDEEVALKVLNRALAEDESYCERFRREAKKMRQVRHSRVVSADDVGILPSGQPFLKMRVMANGSLYEQVRAGRQPEARVRGWARDGLEALECIHAKRIVHRDVKPSNFLLDDGDHACLTDFGIAFTADDARLTRTHEQLGTIAYMAPEQRANRRVTAKSDIFSLSWVLHELLAGEPPTRGAGFGIDGEFGALLREMGDDDPDDRPTATEALTRLSLLGPAVTAEDTAPFDATEENAVAAEKPLWQAAFEAPPTPASSSTRSAPSSGQPDSGVALAEAIVDKPSAAPSRGEEMTTPWPPARPEPTPATATLPAPPTVPPASGAPPTVPAAPEAPPTGQSPRTDVTVPHRRRFDEVRVRDGLTRLRLAGLVALLLVFAVNWAETKSESSLRRDGIGTETERLFAEAAHGFERYLRFDRPESPATIQSASLPAQAFYWFNVRGFSLVYFFLFPLLAVGSAVVWYRRDDPRPFIRLAIGATAAYLMTLPFYLFFPVPERWTYPPSEAILLSDLWSSNLIQGFRPFSGLNNCFPSFHVSLTTVVVVCHWRSRSRWRWAVSAAGAAVVLSTFALGIHWLSDILAGLGCGVTSCYLAETFASRAEAKLATAEAAVT